jgi:copper transport protein
VLCTAAFAVAAALAGGLLMGWQAASLANTPPAVYQDSLTQLLLSLTTGSRAGQLWLVREILLLAMAGLLFSTIRRRIAGAGRADGPLLAAGILGLTVLGTQALASHAAALVTNAYVAVLVEWLHLVAASVWTGGLLVLALSLLPLAWRARRTPALAALLRAGWQPFGPLAALSVGVLIATGLYSLGRQVASPDALITTVYGQALLVKSLLVLGVGAIGLLNASLLHQRVAAPIGRVLRRPPGWTPSLRYLPYLVLAESSLALLVVLASGLITSSVPARGPQFAPQPAGTETLGEHADDLLLIFHADPDRAGTNTFTVDVLGHQGPPADVLRVILRFSYLGQDLGTTSVDATPVSAGKYQVAGPQTGLAGPWQADVVVRRRGLEDAVAHFRWTVAPPGRSTVISDQPMEPALTALAVAILAVTLLGGALPQLWRSHSLSRRRLGEASTR